MKATPWEVAGYGNGWVVERYLPDYQLNTEWLGGRDDERNRPNVIHATLDEARAARDKANGPTVPVSACCGLVLSPVYEGRSITRYRCPCGKVQK